MEAIEGFLRALEIILPYRADGDGLILLYKAQVTKRRLLEAYLYKYQYRVLISTDEVFAERFAKAMLKNLIGHAEELEKPLGDDYDEGSNDCEPGWNYILKDLYSFLTFFISRTNQETPLFKIITRRRYLAQLATLFHSPDEQERGVLEEIYLTLLSRLFEEFAELAKPEADAAERTIKIIGSIVQSGLYDVMTNQNEISLRAVVELLEVLSQ